MTIGGNVGIGTPNPAYLLDVGNRMRVKQLLGSSGGTDSAGIWFYQNGLGNDQALVGMIDDTNVGFYGHNGSGWILTGNTVNGNVVIFNILGIGTSPPSGMLHSLASSASTKPIIAQGAASQTANLQEWQNSEGSALSFVDKNGFLAVGGASSVFAVTVNGNIAQSQDGGWLFFLPRYSPGYGGTAINCVDSTSSATVGNPANAPTFLAFQFTGTEKMGLTNAGRLGIGVTNPSYQLQLSTDSAAKPGSSTWTVASDERLKDPESIEPFTEGAEFIKRLPQPVWFRYRKDSGLPSDRPFAGWVAQDVAEVAPFMVRKTKQKLSVNDKEETDTLSLNTNEVPYAMLNASIVTTYGKSPVQWVSDQDYREKLIFRMGSYIPGEPAGH